jgi:hypothetical protein
MAKAKVISSEYDSSLERELNKFLETIDTSQIARIDYAIGGAGTQHSKSFHYSVLIIYNEKTDN